MTLKRSRSGMPTNPRSLRRRRAALVVGVGALLATGGILGCATAPAPTDHFYRLSIEAPERLPDPILEGTLEIDRLAAPAIMQGRRIAYRDANEATQIGLYSYHHWADALPILVQDILAGYLRALGVAPRVSTPALRVEPTYVLTGRIIQFERLVDRGQSRALVELELALIRVSDRALLLQNTYREEVEAIEDTAASAVAALSVAIERVAMDFTEEMLNAPGP